MLAETVSIDGGALVAVLAVLLLLAVLAVLLVVVGFVCAVRGARGSARARTLLVFICLVEVAVLVLSRPSVGSGWLPLAVPVGQVATYVVVANRSRD